MSDLLPVNPQWRAANLPTPRHQRQAVSTRTTGIVTPFLSSIGSALGLSVSGSDALNIVTVFACVAAIAKTVGRLPLYVYDSKKKELEGHALATLLKYPNPFMTGVDFKMAITANIALYGYSIAKIVRNNGGNVAELHPVPSGQVTWRYVEGRIKYRMWNAYSGSMEEVDFSQVLHFRGLSFDGLNTLSPNDALYNTIQIARAIDTHRSAYYANGGNSSTIIKTTDALTEQQIVTLKNQMSEHFAQPGQARPFILGKGMEAQTLDKTSRDQETTATRKEQDLAICRIFGVPPHMLGIESGSASSASTEQRAKEWIQTSLGYEFSAQEAVFSALLTRAEQTAGVHLKYDIDELASGDMTARFAAYAVARQNGWLSVNEIREEEDYAPIDGGDTYLEPMNMQQAGSGATGNPGTQTTRQNLAPMQTPRFEPAFLNSVGYQASSHSLLEYMAKKTIGKREETKKALEHVMQQWSNASRLKVKNEKPSNEIRLYGEIGWYETSHAYVQQWLDSQSGDVSVRINSPGGDVFEGHGIHTAFANHAAKGHKVEMVVEALAASIAGVITTAGTSIKIASNALLMVHRAWTITGGNASDLRKEADVLDKIDGTITAVYVKRTGLDAQKIDAMLAAETWLTAEESKAQGFADEIIGESEFDPELPAGQKQPPASHPEASTPTVNVRPETKALLAKWAA